MTEFYDDHVGDEELGGDDRLDELAPEESELVDEGGFPAEGGEDIDELALEDPYAEDEEAGASDVELAEWMESEPPPEVDPATADPGSVGALSDVELDSWLGSALGEASGAPDEGELIDRTVEQRAQEDG